MALLMLLCAFLHLFSSCLSIYLFIPSFLLHLLPLKAAVLLKFDCIHGFLQSEMTDRVPVATEPGSVVDTAVIQ